VVDHKAALIALLRRPMPLSSPRGVLASNLGPVAPPRYASTVVLLRDTSAGIEAYMVKRARTMAFAGGVFAFPGGRVDPADGLVDVPWTGRPVDALIDGLAAEPELARALVCAAVRETFEECGVLLAGPDEGGERPLDLTSPEWIAHRRAMERRELGLGELLTRHRLALRAELLAPWARWITPEVEPRRYDTWFFMAALPPGQTPGELSGEADRMEWIRPAEALERHTAGQMAMLPPTASMLADLLDHAVVADVLAAAPGRTITPIMPKIVIADGAVHFLLPHDPEYAGSAPAADPVNAKAIIAAATAGPSHHAWTGATGDPALAIPSTAAEQL
jgi:8-oxo-dGTP pyrophosphatase MutT (NUDIX family)